MLLAFKSLYDVAEKIEPIFSRLLAAADYTSSPDLVRKAVIEARKIDLGVSNIGSRRSLRIVHGYLMGELEPPR